MPPSELPPFRPSRSSTSAVMAPAAAEQVGGPPPNLLAASAFRFDESPQADSSKLQRTTVCPWSSVPPGWQRPPQLQRTRRPLLGGGGCSAFRLRGGAPQAAASMLCNGLAEYLKEGASMSGDNPTPPTKRLTGRPRTNRTKHLFLRLTPEELEQITANATRMSLKPTTYLRKVGLRERVIPGKFDLNAQREIFRQVRGIANNVQQIVRGANTYKNLRQQDIVFLKEQLQKAVELFTDLTMSHPNEDES